MRRLVRVLVAAAVVAAGSLVLDVRQDRQAAATVVEKLEPTASATYEPGGPTEPFFVLLIGSDERPGLDGARADALHVVGLDPASGRATMLNLPRDTWTALPGRGSGRVNEAFDSGGAAAQAEAVQRLTGAPISYVVTTTFVGLAGMVDALGGIDVDVPVRMDDRNSGAVFDAGPVHMDGAQALAFSRNRHVEGGDLARTTHQAQLILHALESLRERGTSAADTIGYLDVLLRHVRTEGTSPLDLYRIGRAALAVDPADVRSVTMPARLGTVGAAQVVFPGPGADSLFADFADDAILQTH